MSLVNMNGGGVCGVGEGERGRLIKGKKVSLALSISGFNFSTNNMDGNYHHIRGW